MGRCPAACSSHWYRSIMPWGQSLQALSWTSEEHGECLEAAPTKAALHSLAIPRLEWDGGL